MNRTTLPVSKLVILIENKVNEFIAAETDFSAYDITLALRATNPAIEIAHQGEGAIVRDVVHNKMVGGAYAGHKSPHAVDWREDHRTTEDGRPFVMYVYDPNWEAELTLVQSEAERITMEFDEFDSFTMGDALAKADGNIPLRRLDALKAAIVRNAAYQGFDFDEAKETFTQIEGYVDDSDIEDKLENEDEIDSGEDEPASAQPEAREPELLSIGDVIQALSMLFRR